MRPSERREQVQGDLPEAVGLALLLVERSERRGGGRCRHWRVDGALRGVRVDFGLSEGAGFGVPRGPLLRPDLPFRLALEIVLEEGLLLGVDVGADGGEVA